MAPYLFWELLFLGIGVWVLAVILVVYAWALLRRQKKMIEAVYEKLDSMDRPRSSGRTTSLLKDLKPVDEPEQEIIISKDEPLSKYANMTVPDSATVSFVDGTEDDQDR